MKPAVQPVELPGRSLPEWIGKTPDSKVPAKVRLRVFERYQGRCYLSGRRIRPGDDWDLDHIKPLKDGGEHRETNLAPALKDAHQAKTARENHERGKVERTRLKHLGAFPKSPTPLKSRNSFRRRWP